VAAVAASLLALAMTQPAHAAGPGVNGRVLALDAKGLPLGTVASATIEFMDRAGKVAARVTADKKGYYKVNLSPGTYTFKVQAPGFKDENTGRGISLTLTEGYAVYNFSLTRGKSDPNQKSPSIAAAAVGTLNGRVLERTEGGRLVGIPRATIALRKSGGKQLTKVVARGDDRKEDGRYEVVLEAGSYHASVAAAGFETRVAPEWLTIAGRKSETQDFVLTRSKQPEPSGQGIKGVITLAGLEGQLTNVNVSVRSLPEARELGTPFSPDAKGGFVRDLPSGRYQVVAEAKGYRTTFSELKDVFAGKYTVVKLRLFPPPKELIFVATVHERFPSNGGLKPLPSVSVLLRKEGEPPAEEARGTTGAEGKVSLKVSAPGKYQVLARMKGYKPAGVRAEIRGAGDNHGELELVKEVSLAALNLRVVEAKGKVARPVAKAKIMVRQEGRTVKAGSSDQEGRFSFSLPPGAYRIDVTAAGYALARTDVTISAGDVSRDIVLTELPAKVALSLRVVERLKAGDKPVPGAQVVIRQNDKRGFQEKTGADGRLAVPLAAGHYTVVVTKPGFESVTVEVSLATQEVNRDIVLTRSPIKKN
jgi:hypothetical protein